MHRRHSELGKAISRRRQELRREGWDQVKEAYHSAMPVLEIDKQIDAMIRVDSGNVAAAELEDNWSQRRRPCIFRCNGSCYYSLFYQKHLRRPFSLYSVDRLLYPTEQLKFPYIIYDLGIVGRLFLPNVCCGEEIHLRAFLLLIFLYSRYDLSIAYDLSRNIREFIELRPSRTRSDCRRRDGFTNDRLLVVGNRRKIAQEVIVVKKIRLALRLRAL